MREPTTDLIQGTLDLLILKSLSLEPMHGFGIARRIEDVSRGVFKVNPGSLPHRVSAARTRRLARLGMAWRPRTPGAPGSTPSRVPAAASCRSKPRTGRVVCLPLHASSRPRVSRMSLWRQVRSGLWVLLRRSAADRDVTDEVQHYLDQATAAHLARGLSASEAGRAARLELGNVTSVREEVRAYGWENLVGTFIADLRYAARGLRNSPGFTVLTVLTTALGMGATTAIFSVVDPVLFRPLPYPDAGRVARIWEIGKSGSHNSATFGMYRELVQRSRSFASMAIMRAWLPTITGSDEPEQASRAAGQRQLFPRARGYTGARSRLCAWRRRSRRAAGRDPERCVLAPGDSRRP